MDDNIEISLPKMDQNWHATDTGRDYQWNGTEWVPMPIFKEWTYETPLEEAVMQSIGAATTCWDNLEGAGIFQSDRAKKIGEELIELIQERENIVMGDEKDPRQSLEEAKLGLATTEELFRELIARFSLTVFGNVSTYTMIERALSLAEMLGGLSDPDKEYRTVGSM